MSFNFGTSSSTSGGSGQSLFGTTNKPAGSGGNLFGNSGTSGTNTTGFSFGSFGQPTSNPPSQPREDNQGSDASKLVSQGFGTPGKTSTPSTSAPSLFGSTTPATSGPSNVFNFGNPSTTPAGPPPSTSAFGASTGGGAGLFVSKPTEETSKPAFNFGTPAATPAPSTGISTASGGLFGSKPASGGFSFGAPSKPAESSSTTSAPGVAETSASEQKQTFSFGAPTSTPSSTTAASAPTQSTSSAAPSSLFGGAPKQPSSGSSLFSKPATTEATASASKATFPFGPPATQAPASAAQTSSGATQKPLFGGFNLGTPTTSSSTTAGATTTTTTAPAAPGASPFSFGPATTAALPSQPATTSASPFSFGGATTTAPTSQSPTTASTAAPTTGATAAPLGVPGTLGTQTSTTGPAPPAQSRLRNKTMDEILTRWATDMSRYSKEFKEHAETIARWDQLIVDNSSKIDKLYVRTRTCERQTMSVDMQLAAVENQQTELESWLTKYENDVDEMLAKDSASPSELGGPDQERERTYKLAEKLGDRLEEMERDLNSMVEEVNAANASLSKDGKADEPITQIVKILNSHLIQLQAIDQGTIALQEKMAAAQKSASNLGYLTSSMNGNSGAAVQDFYRSYMGRR
ncbi:uncharacterized protein Z518_02309 [Rhinocladiella mackenziei CBS 650.93]|uniref:Nucleoporin NSP1-like C-terminal domain-containing protein n=1 Tax=Rhinocladiella mackenziei CBS 650.93 TaxID=1442369 RepID=A0A0D2IWF6_9EURO|nr:uncharacterized protein Z518_02309 [Rhinocladiella mackenziei CBS 650.93]KIX07656.1 hypothetical protein Z518_02309 [Rhinocladiella mackenziei CBS 650.93]